MARVASARASHGSGASGVSPKEHSQCEQVRKAARLVALCQVGDGHDVRSLSRCGYSLHDEDGADG